jgi:hypothetical protein
MNVHFESATPDGAPLRELAETRTRFAMRRLTWLVPRAEVILSDVNGPRGGVDKRCRVELRTHCAGIVQVTALARDWRTATGEPRLANRAGKRAEACRLRAAAAGAPHARP